MVDMLCHDIHGAGARGRVPLPGCVLGDPGNVLTAEVCRLFAMSGGRRPLSARFWLLDAPDSLTAQSHRNPDGTGLGTYDLQGRPVVHKAPISAFSDSAFAYEARTERSTTFLAHIRFASTGALTLANTHPFEQDGRLFAHNGVLGGLSELDDHLGEDGGSSKERPTRSVSSL